MAELTGVWGPWLGIEPSEETPGEGGDLGGCSRHVLKQIFNPALSLLPQRSHVKTRRDRRHPEPTAGSEPVCGCGGCLGRWGLAILPLPAAKSFPEA